MLKYNYLHHFNKFFSNCVFYVEKQIDNDVSLFVKSNEEGLKKQFLFAGKTFIIVSNIGTNVNMKEVAPFFYPKFNWQSYKSINLDYNQYLLNVFGFNQVADNGLLTIDDYDAIYTPLYSKEDISKFVKEVPLNDYLPAIDDNSDDNIANDKETEIILNDIIEKFNILKANGSFITALPILENYIKNTKEDSVNSLSSLLIDDDYKFYLLDYNNLEIKLSHLTKCIYLLFLNNPNGIHLKSLSLFKNELLGYYKEVSNRLDYDTMLNSINDLLDKDSNAIYVHLSRIKSAFCRHIHYSIAENYYVRGDKNKAKKVYLNRELVKWKGLEEEPEFDF